VGNEYLFLLYLLILVRLFIVITIGNNNNVLAHKEFLSVIAGSNIDLISSATLRNADRQLVTDISGQPFATHTLSRNVGN
jgi:hypothetical protein